MYDFSDYGYSYNPLAAAGTAGIICLILAVLGALILFFAFLPERNESKLRGFGLWLHRIFNFRKMFSLGLLKFLYLIMVLYITLVGLYMLFVNFLSGLVLVVLGNLIIRILYEFFILVFSIHDNLSQINANTAQMAGKTYQAPQQPQYQQPPYPPQQPPMG